MLVPRNLPTTLAILLGCLAWGATYVFAQNPAQGPEPTGMDLMDTEPFDTVRFTEESGGGSVRTLPFEFPNREIPIGQRGKLRMKLVGLESQLFQAPWDDIESIELWEKRLLREATERTANGDFDSAYPFLLILMRDYPQTPGLRELRADYLYRNAAATFRDRKYKQTLTILETLRDFDPNYKTNVVLRVLGDVTDSLMQELADEGKLDYAQQLLARLERDYRDSGLSSITKWSNTFLRMATTKRNEAIAARNAGNMRDARRLARESVTIWPRIQNGQAIIDRIDAEYPLVNVGVLQRATVFDPTMIDNWPARRVGRLLYRTLFEISGAGSEGGEYNFIFGKTETSDDRKEIYFEVDSAALPAPLDTANSFKVAELILKRGTRDSNEYASDWASILSNVEIADISNFTTKLTRPHVIPQAMLQRKIDGGVFGGEPGTPTGNYRFDVEDGGETRFVFTGEQPLDYQPREIVEIELADSSDAVSGLIRGQLDVVDQLFPADAETLRKDKRVRVVKYPLPSVHMLIPCSDHEYLADRTFRRAVLYAINRETILSGELLANQSVEGCRVLSGPFPAGIEQDDPLAYAYDESIIPRTYQPRLANLLLTMTTQQMGALAKRKKEEPPKLTPIRLGVPASDIAGVACEAIRSQISMLKDVKIELVPLPPGESWPKDGQCDLVYVIASIWEPVVDARRVLGPDGLARSDSQLIGMGLRQLESAKNWLAVREGLNELHRIAHHELAVLPLWQLVDSYAFRRSIRGVGQENVTLYQNINNWRLSP